MFDVVTSGYLGMMWLLLVTAVVFNKEYCTTSTFDYSSFLSLRYTWSSNYALIC